MKNMLQKVIAKKMCCSALDIGSGETKFVSLAPGEKRPAVMHAARYPTPPGFWSEVSNEELPCRHLEQLVAQHDLSGKEVFSAVGGDSVVTRHISLPKASSKEITETVIKEARKVMPYDTDELVVHHIILEGRKTGKQKELEVLFAALPLSLSYRYYELLKNCGLVLVALDLPAIALWRLFRSKLAQSETVTAIIDIGETRTCMAIAKGQRLQYTRTMPAGGCLLTKSMAESFGINTEQARAMKEEAGLILNDGNLATAETNAMQIDISLRDGLGQLIKEIRRSLDHYRARENASTVGQIILTGGTSKLNGFDRFISEALQLTAEVVRPSSISFDAAGELGYDPAMAVAYGLALRKIQADV